jgi:hypothetical protein
LDEPAFCLTQKGLIMPTRLLLLLLANLIALQTCLPVRADGTKPFIESLPKRLASFTVGTAIGTPIALVRCTKREVVKQTKEAYKLGGVHPSQLGYLPAGFFGIPSGIIFGVFCGVTDGLADSWVNSKDAPFGKESFSLEKLEY